jgi:hypothetical protein
MSRERAETGFLSVAAAAGLVHAGFSLYWALGGRWLLPTVGTWAVDYARQAPVASGFLLAGVASVKVAVALLPLVLTRRPLRRPRLWRWPAWLSAAGLTAYGGANSVAAWLVLGGVIHPTGGYDRTAMIGHAFLWDPLFLAWGLLLGAGLRAGRDRVGEAHVPPA